jgi:uncharacterized protein YjbJ (UPF0337 family)
MNWERIESDWNRFREIIKLRWSKITDRQLDSVEGKRDRLVEAIQAAYRMSQGNAERELASWQASRQHEPLPGKNSG